MSAVSTTILREQGPMSLRDLTAATAKRMGCSLMYDDVAAVMERECREGCVVCVENANDYRERVWAARVSPVPYPGGER